MSNLNQPKGAEPWGNTLRVREYIAAAAIYQGDFVKQDAAGKVAQCAAGDAMIGVALNYASADGEKVLVADHPDQEFVVQADDATIDAQTDLGLNYNIVVASANTTYKRSGMQLDASTQATSSVLPLKCLRIDPKVNNALGNYVDVVVHINNHQLKGGTGTEGV
jgi:hypothetical protein